MIGSWHNAVTGKGQFWKCYKAKVETVYSVLRCRTANHLLKETTMSRDNKNLVTRRSILATCGIWLLLVLSAAVHAQQDFGLSNDSESAPTETVAEPIKLDSSASVDQSIQTRIEGIFSQLDDLQSIQVQVSNSVVTLSGQLSSQGDIEEALALASKVEGVAQVDSALEVNRSVTERLDKSIDDITEGSRFFVSSAPLYAIAAFILIASWFFGRWLSQRKHLLNKLAPNAFIADLFGNLLWLMAVFGGLAWALSLLDATELLMTMLSAAGIVGLAVGFAVRDTVENYIASVLLSLRNPFKVKDYIAVDGHEGSVARLTSRATILITADGNQLRIPNAIVYKSIIVNYTRNPLRRFEFSVGIDSADDIAFAQHEATQALAQVVGVLNDPAPVVIVSELGDSNTTLLIRGWVDQRSYDLFKVRSEAIRSIKHRYDEAGIVMPEPIYRLVIQSAEGLNEAQSSESLANISESPMKERVGSTPRKTPDPGSAALDLSPETTINATIQSEIEDSDEKNLLSEKVPQE